MFAAANPGSLSTIQPYASSLINLALKILSGFGCDHLPLALSAAGCLLQYAQETQRTALPHIRTINHENREDSVILDAATRRNLELDTNLNGGQEKYAVIRFLITRLLPWEVDCYVAGSIAHCEIWRPFKEDSKL